jgi:Fur family ferric uptake transcriptional regulator
MTALSRIEKICIDRRMKMTGQRRVVAQVLSDSDDHPNVDEVYSRASGIDPKISIATVYRTVRLFEEAGILEKHDFGGSSARYEEVTDNHHDHLINIKNGNVIEFHNEEIEALQRKVAKQKGLKLIGHRLELYGVPLDDDEKGQ